MSLLVFDTSSIISIVTNNLLPIMKELKNKTKTEFFISKEVKRELIDYPLTTKKFELEAIMVLHFLTQGFLKLNESNMVREKARYLLNISNKIYRSKYDHIKIVDLGEVEALTLAVFMGADGYVVDERTMRLLIENPEGLRELLSNKLHTRIEMDKKALNEFNKEIKGIKIIRSTEIMVVAYELGLFKEYIHDEEMKRKLLDGILWGLKLRGCSISESEIYEILKLEEKII